MIENIKFRLADETDTEEIYNFINKVTRNKEKNANKLLVFNDAFIKLDEYKLLSIRFNLYNFEEEFFLIQNENNDIRGIISFKLPEGFSKCFNLNLMILENLNLIILNKIFKFMVEKLLTESIVTPSKLRININKKIENYWDIREKFLELGFSHEATRKDETILEDIIISLALCLNK